MSESATGAAIVSPSIEGERYEAVIPGTLDLAERASLALNVLTRNPEAENSYLVWQGMSFRSNPPCMSWPVAAISVKFLESLPLMRTICGSGLNLETEKAMMETYVSLIERDGLQYSPQQDKYTAGAVPASNARMIVAMMLWHQRDGDPAWLDRVRRMSQGLGKIALYRGQYAYYPDEAGWTEDSGWSYTVRGGDGYYSYYPPDEPTREQQGIEGTVKYWPGNVVRALSQWYEKSGDEEALELAGKLMVFMLKPGLWEPGHPTDLVGPEHGIFEGHFHGNLGGLRGMLEYAIATNNKRLKQFVRDAYVYSRNFGISRLGWFPSWVNPRSHGRPSSLALVCEGCGIADITALAIKLSDVGVGDYWEDVDQYVRNQLVEAQLTNGDLMRKVSQSGPKHEAKPPMETNENVIERCVGAFTLPGVTSIDGDAAGCCTGNGTQGLYYAWESIVRFEDGAAQVNLLLNRASPWLDVDSYLPYEGKVVLRNKAADRVAVRIPSWVNREAVRCSVNEEQTSPLRLGNYLVFGGLNRGDAVTIEFPVVDTTETYSVGDTKYTCRFRGNTLVEISPRDDKSTAYPLYLRDHYGADRAPMKTVERYVAPLTIRW